MYGDWLSYKAKNYHDSGRGLASLYILLRFWRSREGTRKSPMLESAEETRSSAECRLQRNVLKGFPERGQTTLEGGWFGRVFEPRDQSRP